MLSYIKLLFLSYDFLLPNGESRAINVASDFSRVSHVLAGDFRSSVPEARSQGASEASARGIE